MKRLDHLIGKGNNMRYMVIDSKLQLPILEKAILARTVPVDLNR